MLKSCPKCSGERKSSVQAESLLGTHKSSLDQGARQHDERQRDIHDADALMIDTGQPLGPQHLPLAVPSDEKNRNGGAEQDDGCGGRRDDAIDDLFVRRILQHVPERQSMKAESSEDDVQQRHSRHSGLAAAAVPLRKSAVSEAPP